MTCYKIIFNRYNTNVGGDTQDVHIMNSDGTGITRLNNINSGYARWSPDGTRILYVNYPESETLYIMNADGSNKTRLGNFDQAANDYPLWIPE